MAFVCKQITFLMVRIKNIGQKQICFDRLLASLHGVYFTTCLSSHVNVERIAFLSIFLEKK